MSTRNDIDGIKLEMTDIKSELKLMMWLIGITVAGVAALVGKALL